jgi:hypothetical protein
MFDDGRACANLFLGWRNDYVLAFATTKTQQSIQHGNRNRI